jgi:hypothetical protein
VRSAGLRGGSIDGACEMKMYSKLDGRLFPGGSTDDLYFHEGVGYEPIVHAVHLSEITMSDLEGEIKTPLTLRECRYTKWDGDMIMKFRRRRRCK